MDPTAHRDDLDAHSGAETACSSPINTQTQSSSQVPLPGTSGLGPTPSELDVSEYGFAVQGSRREYEISGCEREDAKEDGSGIGGALDKSGLDAGLGERLESELGTEVQSGSLSTTPHLHLLSSPSEETLKSELSTRSEGLQESHPPCPYPGVYPGSSDANAMEVDDDDDGDGEVESAEESDAEDLKGDLLSALSNKFSFKGSYAYASSLLEAPNPCLNIDGLGPVGLPLSPRDARGVIAAAVQAPFGHGAETVVDTVVRDTWEIDADRVEFDNPEWREYIQGTVVRNVVDALGVSVQGDSMPRAELYKLLVYEEGSHFLPHQDTVKTQGMFATIVIILPSPYTGGQVHVSHASSSQVFDLNLTSNPLLTTSVLAWYTDVKHEVKPVTSGYRLALSYNLVHVTPGVPLPALPGGFEKEVARLRTILRKWRKGAYVDNSSGVLSHILDHQYSPASLSQGVRALKGTDAHLLAHLIPVAKEQEFFLGLASLECHQIGNPGEEDYGYGGCYYKRPRRGYDRWGCYDSFDEDEEEECPGMGEVQETDITVNNLVDMDGNKPIGDNDLPIGEEELVDETAFEDADPDEQEYEGYMGNGAGSVEQWYKRTVLVLMPQDEAESILFRAGGSTYALDKLRVSQAASSHPSEDDLRLADLIVRNLSSQPAAVHLTMARYTVSWNNLDLWRRVLKTCSISTLPVDELVKGWKVFTFASARMSFEDMISRCSKLADNIKFVEALASRATPGPEQEVLLGWQRYIVGGLLTTLKAPTVDDVPALLGVMKTKGIRYILNTIVPQLEVNSKLHNFWVAFLKALQKYRIAICAAGISTGASSNGMLSAGCGSEEEYENLVRRCLEMVLKDWESDLLINATPPGHDSLTYSLYRAPPVPTITYYARVVEILDLSLELGALNQAKHFLDLVCKSKIPTDNFATLYTSLINHIHQRRASDMFSPPFTEFMQLMVVSVKTPTDSDVPWLMEVLRLKGIPYFLNSFMPQVEKDRTLYPFWKTFLKAFQGQRANIASSSQAKNPADNIQEQMKTFTERCLNIAVASWEHGMSNPRPYYYTPVTTPQSRVMELVELCTSMGALGPCTALFRSLVKRQAMTEENFRTVYNPLVPQLQQHLRSKGLNILSYPFVDLMRVLIGAYLHNVLGAKPQKVVTTRKVGCGCSDCNELDKFMVSDKAEETFRYAQARRTHLEKRLKNARDIVTTDTIRYGSPHGLVVKKVPSVVAWCTWSSRKQQATSFLKNIGPDDLLRKIAGSRYTDVCRALEGTQQFVLPWNNAAPAAAGGSGPSVSASASSSITANTVPLSTARSSSAGSTSKAPVTPTSTSNIQSSVAQRTELINNALQAPSHPTPATSTQATTSALSARLSSASSSTMQTTTSIGKKRKKAPISNVVIDLTEN